MVDISGRRHRRRTISSLHMGHTSLLDALAAAFSLGPSNTLLLMSSLVSAVLAGLLDVCELSDTELSEGARKLALRPWRVCGCGEMAGERFFPLPSTRPPPRDLREAMSRMSREFGLPWWSVGGWGRPPRRARGCGRRYEPLANVAATQGSSGMAWGGHGGRRGVMQEYSKCLNGQLGISACVWDTGNCHARPSKVHYR
jgi:hypothetical protein